MTSTACTVLRSDTSAETDPQPGLWGPIDCATAARYRYVRGHGDRSRTASGRRQRNDAYRRLKVMSGDNYYGQRCELGHNESLFGENQGSQTTGTFALYHQGDRAITYFSERYPDSFSRSVDAWQTVMQMKQTQPADNPGRGPILELQIYDHQLHLATSWHEIWTTRAPAADRWIRYAVAAHYSADPGVGSVKIYVDLNGDGDFLDPGEQSPRFHITTLLTETLGLNGTADGLAPGDAIPDHLRLGLYMNPSIPCLPPDGCSVDIDNVQVLAPK
jgi:hypothetical protein